MAKNPSKNPSEKESLLEFAGGIGLFFVIIGALVWLVASAKIVYFTAVPLRWVAYPWSWIDANHYQAIVEGSQYFRMAPKKITLGLYVQYANSCLLPLSALVCALFVVWYLMRLFGVGKARSDYRRNMAPMTVAREIAKVFPSIVPVLHLGPDLMADKLPKWRRQTFPHEVWEQEKVNVLNPKTGRVSKEPMVGKDGLIEERVKTYFRGGEVAGGPVQVRSGQRWSRMLGYQVVDLLKDVGQQHKICFADRFSPEGKVIFAVLCAYAFGGREGKKDYRKAVDALNRSCAGQANGLPNLTVANWIFEKYRENPVAKKLFGVHHWEFTYLYALFMEAKTNGKATHTDFIWLKPLNRIMFYVLNTVGRKTPHAESSAAFSHYNYEVLCAKGGRLPLEEGPDGKLRHRISIETSVEALRHEYTQYQNSVDDNESDWWKDDTVWSNTFDISSRIQEMLSQQQKAVEAAADKGIESGAREDGKDGKDGGGNSGATGSATTGKSQGGGDDILDFI